MYKCVCVHMYICLVKFQNRWYLLAKLTDIGNTPFFLLLLTSHGVNGISKMAQAVRQRCGGSLVLPSLPRQAHVLPASVTVFLVE